MPLYTYRCNDCEHIFETRQRMSEDPLTDCPLCPGEVRRVINSVGVVFKGNGFYVTDSRKGHSVNGSSNGISADKSKPTKTAESGSETKSESESESKSKSKSDTGNKAAAKATTTAA
jgi:putative FmdB family regulatory protein